MHLSWQDELSDAETARSVQGLPSEESMVLYPSTRSMLESQILLHDERPIIWWLEDHSLHSASYAELHDLAKQAANYLRLKETTFGQRIRLNTRNDLETVVKYWGLWLEGAILVPEKGVSSKELYALSDPFPSSGFLDLIAQQSTEYELGQKSKLSDDAIIFTEQVNRVITLSHNNVLSSGLANSLHLNLTCDDIVICPLSIGESLGYVAGLLTTAYVGASLALCTPDPEQMIQMIRETNSRWMLTTPSLLSKLLEYIAFSNTEIPDRLQFITLVTGLSSELAQQVINQMGCKMITGFHSAECSSFATLLPVNLKDSDYQTLFDEKAAMPIGVELQTTEVNILNDKSSPVKEREKGELAIRGHTVMQRYEGNESETDMAFQGGWLHTKRVGYKITTDVNEVIFFIKS